MGKRGEFPAWTAAAALVAAGAGLGAAPAAAGLVEPPYSLMASTAPTVGPGGGGTPVPPSAATLAPRTPFGTFDIAVSLTADAGLPADTLAAVEQAFDDAERFWERRILGYESEVVAEFIATNFPAVEIDAQLVEIDGAGSVLASAGSTLQVLSVDALGNLLPPSVDNVIVSVAGEMNFDVADVDALLGGVIGNFVDVVRHEMAHVLGFADAFWDYVAATDGTGQDTSYSGPIALATYREEFDADADFVPVEDEGGPGTAFGHWDEQTFGDCATDPACDPTETAARAGNRELMTGFIGPSTFLSETTLASFDDLGYVTTATQPIPLPLSSLLLLSGLGAAVGVSARRRAQASSAAT